jgi:predicted metal-dependent hydrolase
MHTLHIQSHSRRLADFNPAFTKQRVETNRAVFRRVKQVLEQSHCRTSQTHAVASFTCLAALVSEEKTKKPLTTRASLKVSGEQ